MSDATNGAPQQLANLITPADNPVDANAPDYSVQTGSAAPTNAIDAAGGFITMSAPSVVLGFADTVANSLGANPNAVSGFVGKYIPPLADYYSRNQEWAQPVGDIAGSIAVGSAAAKAVESGGMLYKAVTAGGRIPYIDALFASSNAADEALNAVGARSAYLAGTGSQITGDTVFAGLKSQYMGTTALNSIKKGVAFDLGVYGSENKSETLFPAEMNFWQQLALPLAFNAAGAGIEFLAARRQIARTIAQNSTATWNVLDPLAVDTSNLTFRDGTRDTGLGVTALQNSAQRSAADAADVDPLLKKNLNKASLQSQQLLAEQTDQLAGQNTVFGAKGVLPATTLDPAESATMQAVYKNNPTAILGTDALASMPATSKDLDAFITTDLPNKLGDLQDQLLDVQKGLKNPQSMTPGQFSKASQQEQTLQKQIADFQTAEPVVFNADGSVQAAVNRRVRASDSSNFAIVKKPATQNSGALYLINDTRNQKAPQLGVTASFDILAPGMVAKAGPADLTALGNVQMKLSQGLMTPEEAAEASTLLPQNADQLPVSQFGKLNFDQRSQVFLGMNRAIDEYVPGASKVYLHDGSHWTKFDAAQAVIAKNPEAIADFVMPQSARQDPVSYMQMKSLQGKYQDFNTLMDYQEGHYITAKGSVASKLTAKVSPDDIAYMLNLPPNLTNTSSPAMSVFSHARIIGAQDLADVIPDAAAFKQQVQNAVTFPEIAQGVQKQDMPLMGNSLAIGSNSKPVLAIKRPMQATDYTRDALETKMLDDRNISMTYASEAGKYGGDLVQTAIQRLESNPDSAQAKNIGRLVAGTTPGSQDLITQGRYASWNETLKTLNDVSSDLTRVMQHKINDIYKLPIEGAKDASQTVSAVINGARNRANYGDLFKWAEFAQARRFGWDLEKNVINNSDGSLGYLMSDTPFNKRQLEKYFPGTKWNDGAMAMPSMLPGDTYKALAVTAGAHDIQKAMNVLGDAYHANSSALKMAVGDGPLAYKNHWVPPIDLRKQYVSYITRGPGEPVTLVAGKTPGERDAILAQEMANSKTDISRVLQPEDVKNYYDLMDQAFLGKINYVDTLQQTGRARGGLGTRTLQDPVDFLNSTVNTVNAQLQGIGRRSKMLYFEPQVNQVRSMQAVSGAEPNALQRTGDASIWQKYNSMVADSNALNTLTPIGKIYSGIETEFDHQLNTLYDKYLHSGAAGIMDGFKNKRDFQALQDQLGDFSPLKNATDFASTIWRGQSAPTSRELFGKLNNITTKMTIRWLEIGNFLQNSFSTVAIMPAVMKGLQRMGGESQQDWISRIGAYGVPVGSDIAQFSGTKLLTNAMGDFFSAAGRQKMEAAAANGMFDTNHMDLYRTLHGTGSSWYSDMADRADRWASSLSYRGDQWSRSVAYLAGHNLAEHLGYTDEIAKQGFANKIANLATGDFRTVNKPQIFQGAVGMPLGLFQTFIWNYFQRMLGYVENKQYKALATQYAMQGSVFGMQSVPGWDQFNEWIGSANQRSVTNATSVTDALRSRFGSTVADFIIHGAPSTISGINLAARGNTNVPTVPTIENPGETPVANLAKQAFGTITDVYDRFRATGGLSTQDMLEIAARHSISRPLRGLLEIYNGRTTDAAGAVVSDQTRTALGMISRALDLRSSAESNTQEAYYQAQENKASQQIKMDRLTSATRSAFRSSGGIDDDTIKKALVGYVEAGGDPKRIGGWLRDQATTALIPKATRDFMQSIRSPVGLHDAIRYTQMGVWQKNDPEYGK